MKKKPHRAMIHQTGQRLSAEPETLSQQIIMEQEFELSDYTTTLDIQRTETNDGDTQKSGTAATQTGLLRIGILTLGLLCIIQATLNISLRLTFYSKEDVDQFPFSSSIITDVCQIDQSQQNHTQLCSCYNKLLRRLLGEYQALKTERDLLRDKVIQQTKDKTGLSDFYPESGSGSLEDFNEYS